MDIDEWKTGHCCILSHGRFCFTAVIATSCCGCDHRFGQAGTRHRLEKSCARRFGTSMCSKCLRHLHGIARVTATPGSWQLTVCSLSGIVCMANSRRALDNKKDVRLRDSREEYHD